MLVRQLEPGRRIERRILRVQNGSIASNAYRANLVLHRRFERRVSPLPRDCIAVGRGIDWFSTLVSIQAVAANLAALRAL
jgi:hypothetical protein